MNPTIAPKLLKENQTLAFAGLRPEDADQITLPESVRQKLPFPREEPPLSLEEVIELLPQASIGELRSNNPFINADGTLNVAAIDAVDGIETSEIESALNTNLQAVSHDHPFQQVPGYAEIIDERRAALNAAGHPVKYQWQVATDTYAIINPDDVYSHALQTFAEFNEHTDIFGWIDYRDFGGDINLYILFADETVPAPNDLGGEIFFGYHTGYDFASRKRLFLNHFAYYPRFKGRFYNIGKQLSRKHVGDPTNSTHESDNNRTPISEWWNTAHKAFLESDELLTCVKTAENVTIDFDDRPFTKEEFYRLLGLPITLAEQATDRLELQTRGSTVRIWDLALALVFTVSCDFQGDTGSARFRAHCEQATKLIRDPHRVIRRALRDYKEGELATAEDADADVNTSHPDLQTNFGTIESIDDLQQLDGVTVGELELPTEAKAELIEATEQQLIYNYS